MFKFYKFTSLILIFVLLLPFTSSAASNNSDSFPLSAQHACLYIPKADISIYGKSANERHAMASTTKIMTALIALENCELDRVVTISPIAVGIEGSSIYLKAGDKYYMEDLLFALLLQSANDVATAIAIEVGGSVEGFVALMNKKADEMGLKDTHFENPHGLDGKEHYTTAYELALITAEALKNPKFKSIVGTYKKTISTIDGSSKITVVNHNKMLLLYEDAIGVKTGFTKKTGRCLVSAAERDGLTLISVTLNASDDWDDHRKLLDYGFEKYENRILASKDEINFELPVINGTLATVNCSNKEDVSLIIKRDTPEAKKITEMNRFVIAPIKKGDILGYTHFEIDGKIVASTPIYANQDIPDIKYKKGLFR